MEAASLATSMEEQHRNALQARVNEAAAESRAAAERDLSRKLNQAVRCLRGSENGDWSTELVQATQGFCDRAAVFTLHARDPASGSLARRRSRQSRWTTCRWIRHPLSPAPSNPETL